MNNNDMMDIDNSEDESQNESMELDYLGSTDTDEEEQRRRLRYILRTRFRDVKQLELSDSDTNSISGSSFGDILVDKSRMNFNMLPDDVLQCIFLQLMRPNKIHTRMMEEEHPPATNLSKMFQMALTCRCMRDLYYQSLWHVTLSDDGDENFRTSSDEQISNFVSTIGSNIKRLHVGPLKSMGAKTLESIETHCDNLNRLEFIIKYPLPQEQLQYTIRKCADRVNSLHITLQQIYNPFQAETLSRVILTTLQDSCYNVEHLVLSGLKRYSDEAFVPFMQMIRESPIKSLGLLMVDGNALSNRELYAVGKYLNGITHLYLSCGTAVREWQILGTLVRLRTTLKCVHLYGSGVLHRETLTIILQECILLRELRFIRTHVYNLPESFFSLPREERRPDFVMIGLQGFGDYHCQLIHRRQFENLKKIVIVQGDITDTGLRSLLLKSLTSLKQLRISGCMISGISLKFIGQYCVNLEQLSLENNNVIKDCDIGVLVSSVKNLKKLSLLNLGKITITSLRILAHKQRCLEEVRLDEMFKIRVDQTRLTDPMINRLKFTYRRRGERLNQSLMLEEYKMGNPVLLPDNMERVESIGRPPWYRQLQGTGLVESVMRRPWLIEELDFEVMGCDD